MNKKLLAVAVSSALAAPMAAQAVKYKLSGQVNRAIVYQDDGKQTDIQFIDNTASGSRWRLVGSEDMGRGMKVGFNWEWQNSSNNSTQPIKSGDTGDGQTLRKAEVWFSGGWGKLSLGQGDGAGNGTTEADLSGTLNANASGRDSFGGSLVWRTSAGGGINAAGGTVNPSTGTGALTHGATFNAFDAFSRYDRIRYDTPALGPVTLSASAGQADRYEGAVRWSQGLGGGQISAAAFYGTDNGGGVKSRYGGSVAYLFSFGTALNVAYGGNDTGVAGESNANTWYLKAGQKWGNNAVSIGYGESKDTVQGFKDKGFNIGFNHVIPKVKVDLYAGFHYFTLDTPGGSPSIEDQFLALVGTRLKFD